MKHVYGSITSTGRQLIKAQVVKGLILSVTQFYTLHEANYYLGIVSGGKSMLEAVWTGLQKVLAWESRELDLLTQLMSVFEWHCKPLCCTCTRNTLLLSFSVGKHYLGQILTSVIIFSPKSFLSAGGAWFEHLCFKIQNRHFLEGIDLVLRPWTLI